MRAAAAPVHTGAPATARPTTTGGSTRITAHANNPNHNSGFSTNHDGKRYTKAPTLRKARAPITRTAVRVGAAKDDLLLELVQALSTLGAKRVEKDFNELVVEPFSDLDPKPIKGLLPPRDLADDDSKFVVVHVRGQAGDRRRLRSQS
jgi:hypothetical protein